MLRSIKYAVFEAESIAIPNESRESREIRTREYEVEVSARESHVSEACLRF